jgi:hypothetical protein
LLFCGNILSLIKSELTRENFLSLIFREPSKSSVRGEEFHLLHVAVCSEKDENKMREKLTLNIWLSVSVEGMEEDEDITEP